MEDVQASQLHAHPEALATVMCRLNQALSAYVGRHNFHSFACAREVSRGINCERTILECRAEGAALQLPCRESGHVARSATPPECAATPAKQAYVKISVTGESFMMHQIRKMVGLAIAVARGSAGITTIQTALSGHCNVPTAPAAFLLMDAAVFKAGTLMGEHQPALYEGAPACSAQQVSPSLYASGSLYRESTRQYHDQQHQHQHQQLVQPCVGGLERLAPCALPGLCCDAEKCTETDDHGDCSSPISSSSSLWASAAQEFKACHILPSMFGDFPLELFDFAKSLPSHDYSVVSSRLPVEANFTGLNSVGIQGQRRRGRACHDLSAAILGGLETYGLRKVWD